MAEKLIPAKKVKNGVLYKSGHIKVSNIRASYPHLGAPYGGDGEGEKGRGGEGETEKGGGGSFSQDTRIRHTRPNFFVTEGTEESRSFTE